MALHRDPTRGPVRHAQFPPGDPAGRKLEPRVLVGPPPPPRRPPSTTTRRRNPPREARV